MRKEIYLLIGLNLAFFFANNVDRYLCHDLSCGKIETLTYKSVALNVSFVLYIWLFKAEKKEIIEQVDDDSASEDADEKMNTTSNNTTTAVASSNQKHLSVKAIQATLKTPDPQITFKSEVHPNRVVLCRDSIRWLNEQTSVDYVVTSLPDHSEMKLTLDQWKSWFVSTAALIMSKLSNDGLALFYQTDCRITDKNDHVIEWVDKSFLIQTAAAQSNCKLLWHKIMLQGGPELNPFGRPSYSHLICFTKNLNDKLTKVSPDVAHRGKAVWKRGMGYHSTLIAVEFIKQYCPQPSKATIVDPFCGHGTVLAVANYLGFNAIGIDCVSKFCKAAVKLTASDEQLIEIKKGGSSKEKKED